MSLLQLVKAYVYCEFMTQRLRGPALVITRQMRELRRAREWSAQRLGDEMTAAGIPWDRAIIANLETGRRTTISIEEWLTLAQVLGVAPLHLLVPVDNGDDFPATPTTTLPADVARAWIIGEDPAGLLTDDSWWHRHRPFERTGTGAAGGAASGTKRVVRRSSTTARPDPRKDT